MIFFLLTYSSIHSLPEAHTFLTVRPQVAGAITVANVSVPALLAVAPVGTRISAAPHVSLPGAQAADTDGALNLAQPPQVATLAVNEEVPHAAHVAQAQRGAPHLRREDETMAVVGKTAQIHVPVEVKDLAALVGRKGDAFAVHRNKACGDGRKHSE